MSCLQAANGELDLFGFLSRLIPERLLHDIIRGFVVAACMGLIYWRFGFYQFAISKLQWWAQTVLFAAYAAAYAVRIAPIERSQGAAEFLVPLIAVFLPLLLFRESGFYLGAQAPMLQKLGLWLVILGGFFTSAGGVSLGRSFSITPEVRELRTSGLYRFVRHPIYLAGIVVCFGVLLTRPSFFGAALWALFAALQVWRARLEEKKLSCLPGYSAYCTRTGFFLPRFSALG